MGQVEILPVQVSRQTKISNLHTEASQDKNSYILAKIAKITMYVCIILAILTYVRMYLANLVLRDEDVPGGQVSVDKPPECEVAHATRHLTRVIEQLGSQLTLTCQAIMYNFGNQMNSWLLIRTYAHTYLVFSVGR